MVKIRVNSNYLLFRVSEREADDAVINEDA